MGKYNNDVFEFASEHPIISFLVASAAISGVVNIVKYVSEAVSGKPVGEGKPVNLNITVPNNKEASKDDTVEPEVEVVETEPEESDETENT